MLYQTIKFQTSGSVTVIHIDGLEDDPFKMERLSDELTDLCTEISWDEGTRVVILTGSGEESFSAKIKWRGEAVERWSIAEPVAKVSQPVIIALNGDAIGQGLELALACDFRIATGLSNFGLRHIEAGLIPWDGGTQRLSRLIGRGKAIEMILTGEVIDAREAYRIGLVNKIGRPDELMKTAMNMAQEMASKGPIALKYAKEAIWRGMELTSEQGLRLEADLYLMLHTTRDREEGIRAFREKRVPKFEGR